VQATWVERLISPGDHVAQWLGGHQVQPYVAIMQDVDQVCEPLWRLAVSACQERYPEEHKAVEQLAENGEVAGGHWSLAEVLESDPERPVLYGLRQDGSTVHG
jgi:hypothetical protein